MRTTNSRSTSEGARGWFEKTLEQNRANVRPPRVACTSKREPTAVSEGRAPEQAILTVDPLVLLQISLDRFQRRQFGSAVRQQIVLQTAHTFGGPEDVL